MILLQRILKLSISIVFLLYCLAERLVRLVAGKPGSGVFVILYYHPVPDSGRERFARQMDVLLKTGKAVGLEDGAPREGKEHCVAVTFDDAYRSVLRNALPELAKRGIPSAIFAQTDYLGERPEWIANESHEYLAERVMTREELRSLKDDPLVTIGSHTASHPRMTRLSEKEAREELAGSKRELEDIMGGEVKFLAYPFGDYNEEVAKWTEEAGYQRAYTTIPGLRRPGGDEFLHARTDATPFDWPIEFRLKVLGAYRWLRLAVRVKRCLRRLLQGKPKLASKPRES